jgi:predicted amidohydrolase YtcJ
VRKVVAVDDEQRRLGHLTVIMTDWSMLLLSGGPVYTLDPARPRARGVAIDQGRIVGLLDETPAERPTVDLAGRAVLPGFIDAHVHFVSFALGRQEVDLEPTPTLQAGLDRLRRAVEQLPPGAWLRGRGWDRNRWGCLPTAAVLDGVAGARPAVLASHDGHALWLNRAALRHVGLSRATPDPAGGAIERDPDGEPTGVVFENARDLVWRAMPARGPRELADAIRAALPIAAAAGLTGIHTFEDAQALEAFRLVEQARELTLRVWHGVARAQLPEAHRLGLRTGAGSDWLAIGPLKLYADGALGSRTAHLIEPYEGRADDYRGLPTLRPDELRADLRTAAQVGLDVAIHAIGDAAVRGVLDAVEETRRAEPRLAERLLRIEHAQLVQPSDRPRFAALDVIASMQPSHAVSDWRAADAHWGARARNAYAWRSLLAAGARLAFGTDAPVERIEPLPSLHAAVTRLDLDGQPPGGWYPDERLELLDAVRAYTLGAAGAGRAAHRRGSLAVGKDADLVVLSTDPFQQPAAALLDARVDLTIVGGKIVYQR